MERTDWPHRDTPNTEAYTFKHDTNCSGIHVTCNTYHADGDVCMTCLPDLAWGIESLTQNQDSALYAVPFDTLSIRDNNKVGLKDYVTEEEDTL